MWLEKLFPVLPVAQDRPGDHHRKVHPVQHHLQVIPLRLCNAVIHVHHIAQQRKGIERHPQRNQKIHTPDQFFGAAEQSRDTINRINTEIHIFQHNKNTNIDQYSH